MINVQYPFLDLTKALLILLQDLKPVGWAKVTLFKNYEINIIAKHLLEIHHHQFSHSNKAFTLGRENVDTAIDIYSLKEQIKSLELKAKSITFNSVEDDVYAYCWLLQQYIREALNNRDLIKSVFYSPFLHSVMQHLASHYQSVEGSEETLIHIEIVGEAGGIWMIEKVKSGWKDIQTTDKEPDATVYLDQQIAWLLFSDSLHVNEIGQFYQLIGNKQLGNHFLTMRTRTPSS